MLIDTTVPPGRGWNTWSERPAEMVFLPLGVRITPVLYSGHLERATAIRPPDEVRFGRHDLAGERIAFETRFGGTRLGFRLAKTDPFVICGGWSVHEAGEWGLRYWVTLCLSAEGGEEVRRVGTAALVNVGGRFVALVVAEPPVLTTGHPSVAAVVADYERNGYFDKSGRSDAAPTLALRFNLEMAPAQRFAAAVADTAELAIARAREALTEPADTPALHEGRNAGALDAVRDVVGWNTVFDRGNRRITTTASRIWGLGDAVWYNDQCIAALMAGLFDPWLGRQNLAVAMSSATPQGNIACFVNPQDAWVDRTQPPHGAFIVWSMFLRTRDRSLLKGTFDLLARNQLWWRAHRDPDRRGLVSCGSSDVGDAMYRGTPFGARNESGMDNSPTHDEAVYDAATGTLSTLDVGLNSALALDAEMLAAIGRELGLDAEAALFASLAQETCERIRSELWDEERALFANRQRGGGFVRSVSPTSLFPLLCGAADAGQAARLVQHLDDPRTFGGRHGLPNVARADPAYREQIYWRGRIWPNVNWVVWHGLRRYGFAEHADALAAMSLDLFMQSWADRRRSGENYGAETGEIDDCPGNDPFYTWGALLPLMAVSQVMDVGPWNGWELACTSEPVRLGPLESPAGPVIVTIEAGVLTVASLAGPLFSTDAARLTHIVVDRRVISVTLAGPGTTFRLGPEGSARFVAARLGGREVAATVEDGCRVVAVAGVAADTRLDIYLEPRR